MTARVEVWRGMRVEFVRRAGFEGSAPLASA
jgi:hypothetical protein